MENEIDDRRHESSGFYPLNRLEEEERLLSVGSLREFETGKQTLEIDRD